MPKLKRARIVAAVLALKGVVLLLASLIIGNTFTFALLGLVLLTVASAIVLSNMRQRHV